ncbi:MAG TPA: GspE/PulE family protein [Candidatus Absconditabacterales bacterium]|nr:GspE/PulE family protein [Candidatus Absconditabacterales bacterium]
MNQISKTILDIQDIQAIKPDFDSIKILKREVCEKTETIVFDKDGNTLKVLSTNNFPEELNQIIGKLEETGLFTEIFYTSTEGFQEAIKWYDDYEKMLQEQKEKEDAQKQASGEGAIGMIKKIYETRDSMEPGEFIMEVVRLAFQTGASDLHLQPQDNGVLLRIRVDGVMQEILRFTHADFKKYLQKLKFIAGTKMNIDYVPQDGRFSFEAVNRDGENKKVDARVSFMPGMQSESTVIRFLDPTKGISTFEKIGFTGNTYEVLKRNLEKNTGIIIFTGPTGSGKTTTLYTILNYLNDGKNKIITLEDPIEYELRGIQQSQINYNKGYTYAKGLKAILRHDPDTILVGETRDLETADIAINAALTGHRVFTTLHTNSAIESIPRLVNMGLQGYMLAPSLNLIVAQRLVRGLCPHCSTKRDANFAEKSEIEDAIKKINDANPKMNLKFDGKVPQAIGCDQCNGSGYKGRMAVLETFEITEDIKNLIIEGKVGIELYSKARENGYLTLREDGIIKVLEGKTTLDEIRRVI